MSDVLVINGTTIDQSLWMCCLDRCVLYGKGSIPELHFYRPVGALATLPDAWSGQTCTLTVGGTLVFSGDIVGYIDRYANAEYGWVREYRALGLRNRADWIPVTDANTFTDTATYNLPGDDPNFIGSRAGLTVGAIVTSILTMTTNGAALAAAGLVNYASGPPYVLPSATVTDLAALTVIPPWRVTISGERILQALESFVQSLHPNHILYVLPSGTIRFLDMRSFAANTLTLGADSRLGMPQLTRDYADSYSAVVVRGNTAANAVTLQTSPWPGSASADGGLQEDFAWGIYTTNAAAIAAWVPANYTQPGINTSANDTGSCTCPTTTTVTVTSNNPAAAWPSNFWAQGGGQALGQVYLYADSITSVSQFFVARVISNTALTAGGTSTLTIDRALPALTYNSYSLFGTAENAALVWKRYKCTNANIGAALLNYFPIPALLPGAAGAATTVTTTPIGFVWWSQSGTPPYNVTPVGISVDPTNGLIYFDRPTALVYGNPVAPTNVSVFVPVATGSLSVRYPSSGFQGTLSTVEGVSRVKTITCQDWRDYGNTANMTTFASEYLNSVQDVVVEGSVPYNGLLATFLTMGQAVSIAGSGYTTGWESLGLPVVAADLVFNQSERPGTSYSMNLHLSNRRGRYSAAQFLRPSITSAVMRMGGGSISASGGGLGGFGAGSGDTTAGDLAAQASASSASQQDAAAAKIAGGPSPGVPEQMTGPGSAVPEQLSGPGAAAPGQIASGQADIGYMLGS